MSTATLENKEGDSAESPSSYMDDLYDYARLVAVQLGRRYSLVSVDDIAQEIVLYVWQNEKVWSEWEDYCIGDYPDEETAKHMAARMRLVARRAGERFCRKDIAAALGYKPEDEAFYSLATLRILVEHYYQEGVTERPSEARGERTGTRGDPATGGNWLASLLDVQRALDSIPRRYKFTLKLRFQDLAQYSNKEIAEMSQNLAIARGKRERIQKALGGSTEASVYGRTTTALKKLQARLGGQSPYGRDPE